MRIRPRVALLLAIGILHLPAVRAESPAEFRFEVTDRHVAVALGEQPIARYVLRDENTPRPYFSDLRTATGVPVTRNHPPQAGDSADHALMHPGLWMAFGDLSGSDNWRLQAKVLHERLIGPVQGGRMQGRFTVENRYLDATGEETLGLERRRLDFVHVPGGWLLVWDSTFSSNAKPLTFGDQEEMGLGVRMATPLAVASNAGGRILDAAGHASEREARGQSTAWCDYSGWLQGRFVGVTLLSHPENFRPSWQHVRDYGLMVVNPFGRRALTGGPESRVTVQPGEELRLRFGVIVHDTKTAEDYRPGEMYQRFLEVSCSLAE